jgi:uncharacterized delta-60 repeat protein
MRLSLVFLVLLVSILASAQPGALDPTFDGDGRLVVSSTGTPRVCALPDGRLMVAATNDAGSVKLMRLLLDGSPDLSFGTNGIVLVPTPVGTLDLSGFTLRPDGSGVLLGSVAADGGVPGFGCVIQVSEDGTLDTNFGTNGLVSVGFPDGDVQLLDLALESSGALVVCGVKVRPNPASGQPAYKDAVALRVDASGLLDPSFNGGGAWVHASEIAPYRAFTARFVHALPNGNIVLRGSRNYLTAPGSDGWQITLLPDGTPVASLALLTSGGFGPYSIVGSAVNTNGTLLLAGYSDLPPAGLNPQLSATLPSGTSNSSGGVYWGHPGPFGVPFSSGNKLGHAISDASGRFLFAGLNDNRTDRWYLGRTIADGSIWDQGFGTAGEVETVFPAAQSVQPTSMCVLQDGRIVVAGKVFFSGVQRWAFARYNAVAGAPGLVAARVNLGGAYDSGTALMKRQLFANMQVFPYLQPYMEPSFRSVGSVPQQVIPIGAYTNTSATGMVDWIWLEYLSTSEPSTILASRAALVLRNGQVVDVDGVSPVDLRCGGSTGFLRIRHRNHLGVTCSVPISLDGTPTVIDLTMPSTPTFGTDAQACGSGVCMMWPGDTNGDAVVSYTGPANDRDAVLLSVGGDVPSQVLQQVYHASDINLDGNVKYVGLENDRDAILRTIGGNIPSNVRHEQLP